MTNHHTLPELSLIGGPLHRLGIRLGLVRGGTNTRLLGLSLGLLAWIVLILLAFIEDPSQHLFALPTIGVPVRLVLAIPLMFLCETWAHPQVVEFARYLEHSGVVPAASLPTLASDIRRIDRLKDSSLAEAVLLLVAFGLPLIEVLLPIPGSTGSYSSILHAFGGKVPWTVGWYLAFCLPLFRFLLFRGLWHLGLWWYFLWRVERLNLHLVPIHSDRTAGLGLLDTVHECFFPVAFAVSAIFSAKFAENISTGAMAFTDLRPWIPMVVLLTAGLFLAPLLMFCGKLWRCRVAGMSQYMSMASHYVNAFESKWIRDERLAGVSQLGDPDLQSLADLTNSVQVIRNMRWIPIGRRQVTQLAVATIVPLLPLLFLKYPIDEMAVKLFQALTGL